MALADSVSATLRNQLQKVALLALGRGLSDAELQGYSQLTAGGHNWQPLVDQVNAHMQSQARASAGGEAALIQQIAQNVLGVSLAGNDATAIAKYLQNGQLSWADLFVDCMDGRKFFSKVFDNRTLAADNFAQGLDNHGKTADFTGSLILDRYQKLLNSIQGDSASLATAQTQLSKLLKNIVPHGISGTVLAGTLSDALLFVDSNGDYQFNRGEYVTRSDANGHYFLPGESAPGQIFSFGGTNRHTQTPFTGTLWAAEGDYDLVTPSYHPSLRSQTITPLTLAALDSKIHWESAQKITYSIPVNGSTWLVNYPGGTFDPGYIYSILNARQAENFRAAVNAWGAAIAVPLVEVQEPGAQGQIRVAFSGMPNKATEVAGYAYYPGTQPYDGDVWLRYTLSDKSFEKSSDEFATLLHELGHALGLKHPFQDKDAPGAPVLPKDQDSSLYTVMSYTQVGDIQPVLKQSGNRLGLEWNNVSPTTPKLYDILAIQSMYGKNPYTGAGDTVYTFQDGTINLCLWDASGTDTLDLSALTRPAEINLEAGAFSSIGHTTLEDFIAEAQKKYPDYAEWIAGGLKETIQAQGERVYFGRNNFSIAYGAEIENATGSASDDILRGNALNNVLIGNGGIDVLTGGAGRDVFRFVRPTDGTDILMDFRPGEDKIQLLGANFGLSPGQPVALHCGDAPECRGADAQLLYDSTQGLLAFDADGDAGGAALPLAVLLGTPTLTVADFMVV